MSALPPDRTPVIVGTGEITHRSKAIAGSLEPIVLMHRALQAAEVDAGPRLLSEIDSLDVVCEYSWPYDDAPGLLAARLGIAPRHSHYGAVGGESPVRFIHEAALRIQRGECTVAAVVGAEARYSVEAARKAGAALPWTPAATGVKLPTGADYLPRLAALHGVTTPVTVYPLYENATQASWGQTPREALQESAALWSRYSQVAATNPQAWLAHVYTPEEVATPGPGNRLIAWPYTLHMVANPLVNMGAGVLLTSLGRARALGVPADRIVYLWGGAAAAEPRSFLGRDQFVRAPAQDEVLETVLAQAGGDVAAFEMLELYSCFPVVPKMARRTLGLAADAQMTSTGGLSFFGAPLNNYMTHAAAGLVRALRRAPPGRKALCYGQGGHLTKHHAVVLSSEAPPIGALGEDYSVQAAADARRGRVPTLADDYTGPATLETHTVVFDRQGGVAHGTVIARTPHGQRSLARVEPTDEATLAVLMDLDRTPIGSTGEVRIEATAAGERLQHWRSV